MKSTIVSAALTLRSHEHLEKSTDSVSKTLKIALVVFLIGFIASPSVAQELSNTGKYRVTAYKKGNNTVYSTSNQVDVLEKFTLYIPNAFTPNGDGLNETFGPVGNAVNKFSMLIFNRWGQMIFESEDMNHQWDGTYKGEKVQTDTYVYKIFATGEESGSFQKTGKITVII